MVLPFHNFSFVAYAIYIICFLRSVFSKFRFSASRLYILHDSHDFTISGVSSYISCIFLISRFCNFLNIRFYVFNGFTIYEFLRSSNFKIVRFWFSYLYNFDMSQTRGFMISQLVDVAACLMRCAKRNSASPLPFSTRKTPLCHVREIGILGNV